MQFRTKNPPRLRMHFIPFHLFMFASLGDEGENEPLLRLLALHYITLFYQH